MEFYLGAFKKYADFSGRARRKEYWMFVLFNFIAALILAIVGMVIKTTILSGLYSLAVLVPSLAISARRLHDIGKSGWWLLISFVPVIGGIWLLILFCTDSTNGMNTYGENPKMTM